MVAAKEQHRQASDGEGPERVKKPTIKEVARLAGVSIATVSFVLNDRPGEAISQKVKKRVWQIARQLDYHPSAMAAGLARRRTRNVAILLYNSDSAITNQFYSFVIQGAIKETIDRHYNLLFSYMSTTYRGPIDLPKIVREKNVEGVLVPWQVDPALIRDIQDRGISVVAVDTFPAVTGVDSLQIDNRRGGRLATDHLLDLGHERVGFLVAASDRPSVAERGEGFREALVRRGMRFSKKEHVFSCDSFTFEGAHERILRALQLQRRPTALFCANDEMAAGAIRAAHDLRLAVPAQLSIVGFDNIAISRFLTPALTTVSVVKEELGRRGMARLLELVEGGERRPQTQVASVELIVRDSTARPGRLRAEP